MKKVNVAIVGATGLVGQTFLKVLEERDFPIQHLYCFASSRSAGKEITFKGKTYVVEELTEHSFDYPIDIALFSAGGDVSKKFAPIAVSKGVRVVDNSSAWRMDPDVALIVPEVNGDTLTPDDYLIANPNCSTIQSVVPLRVLHEAYQIKRIVYSTYQAVSGSGMKGLKDLEEGTQKFYPHPITGNCLPHIDVFFEDGYTKEEVKMIEETKKILNDQENHLDYPLPLDVAGHDEVHVGRIRRDFSVDSGLNLWVVADNIRKGAATNAVQIAESLLTFM